MLYKNKEQQWDNEQFQNPAKEYRGTPFWAWNCKLDTERLKRQIDYFKEMGFGGFHMHSRVGMDSEYLGEEFMQAITECTEKAEQNDMLAWLYDEDCWPSGSAGGYTCENALYHQRYLQMSTNPNDEAAEKEVALKTGKPYLLGCFDVVLDISGNLVNYQKISPDRGAEGQKWYAYSIAAGWYIDVLNKDAVKTFIDNTYEKYKSTVGEKFGETIPAIFTDEPQYHRVAMLNDPFDTAATPSVPWSHCLEEEYLVKYGSDISDSIPDLFWDLSDSKTTSCRYRFYDLVSELFSSGFAGQLGAWCEQNGLLFTGHLMGEPSLGLQTEYVGDAMRFYPNFQLPGMDLLADNTEFSTAKQVQSSCHQCGREGVLSELYGVTRWDFDFREHKFQGDWQAALGVSVRVPHLSWVSMKGEAKRDYPATINYQSPWFREYSFIENHFARVAYAMTRGKPEVKIGVIHPIESYWLHMGTGSLTSSIRKDLDRKFSAVTTNLLSAHLDYDFICEATLPSLLRQSESGFAVGEMSYGAVIVPYCETLRSTTLAALKDFQSHGGLVIFMGKCPTLVDAFPSDEGKELYDQSVIIDNTVFELSSALKEFRSVEIMSQAYEPDEDYIYSLREETGCKWLFVARKTKQPNKDRTAPYDLYITVKGDYTPVIYNTVNGEIQMTEFSVVNGVTKIPATLFNGESLLLRLLKKVEYIELPQKESHNLISEFDFKTKVSYQREEPNVLLLDLAEYRLDNAEWSEKEEILKLHNICNKKLGYSKIYKFWQVKDEKAEHTLDLRMIFQSEIEAEGLLLAVEEPEKLKILLNGETVNMAPVGYYVDEDIKAVCLPRIKKGENELLLTMPFTRKSVVEWCYILGEFDVRVEGCTSILIPCSNEIGFGSIVPQGLPFYGGNIIYRTEIETPDCRLEIEAGHYRGALVQVTVDGKSEGKIVLPPYRLIIPTLLAGKHTVEFKVFGTRQNSFGPIHQSNRFKYWTGPDSYTTYGDDWSYEYTLNDFGLMASPIVRILEK